MNENIQQQTNTIYSKVFENHLQVHENDLDALKWLK